LAERAFDGLSRPCDRPLLAARGWREPVGQVADQCLSREGRFLRDEERAATFPTRDVSPASGARAKLTA
jgi:hypothetical protein